jgi:hypothetical protein
MIGMHDGDSEYWYAVETKRKKIVDKMCYSKTDFDFMGEK